MRRSRFLAIAAFAAILAISVPSVAIAAVLADANPNCLGNAASQIAWGEFEGLDGGMGAHASSQPARAAGLRTSHVASTSYTRARWHTLSVRTAETHLDATLAVDEVAILTC